MKCQISSLELRSPIILGSCDLFVNEENIRKYFTESIGAIVLKTTTREAREGYKKPHVANFGVEGLIVASGMANPGIEKMSELARKVADVPLIGSVNESSLAKNYSDSGVIAIELNLSCPHTPGGIVPAHCPEKVYSAVAEAKDCCDVPVFAKLTGWNCDIRKTAEAAQKAGADAVVVSNLFPGTGYYTGLVAQDNNYRVGECLVGNGQGGYTGAGFLSGVLYMIKQIREVSDVDIIATGGCCNDVDSLAQTYLSGARAFETVTPVYKNKDIDKIYREFLSWREENDI